MTKQDRTLLALRDLLYGKSWEAMRADLLERLMVPMNGHARHLTIKADLARVEELMHMGTVDWASHSIPPGRP